MYPYSREHPRLTEDSPALEIVKTVARFLIRSASEAAQLTPLPLPQILPDTSGRHHDIPRAQSEQNFRAVLAEHKPTFL